MIVKQSLHDMEDVSYQMHDGVICIGETFPFF